MSAQAGLLFQPPPALAAATISKDASKAATPSSTDSTDVAIPNNKNAHRVGRRCAGIGPRTPVAHGNRVAPAHDAFSGSHLPGRVRCSDGRFERALAPGCGEDLWRGVWPNAHAVLHALPLGHRIVS
jgi:hypothetical protein